MRLPRIFFTSALLLSLPACGDDSSALTVGDDGSATGTDTNTGTATTPTSTTSTDTAMTDSSNSGTASGTGTGTEGATDTDVATDTMTSGMTDPTTTMTSGMTDTDTTGGTDPTTGGTVDPTTGGTVDPTTGGTVDPTTGGSSSTTGMGTSSTTGMSTSSTTAMSTSTTGGGMCMIHMCGNKLYECGNCIDDDNDGTIDLADVECVTPCDDDESKFATGIPGDNVDPCKQDCFFDGDSGSGNDKCDWNLKCDPMSPGAPECPYDAGYMMCPNSQPAKCLEVCFVPNGCDCFGCCTVSYMGTDYDIYLGDPNCDVENLPSTCNTCTKNADCDNSCNPENCEVCFGQELPPGCVEPTCPDMQQPCIEGELDNCPMGQYCQTGCCVPEISP